MNFKQVMTCMFAGSSLSYYIVAFMPPPSSEAAIIRAIMFTLLTVVFGLWAKNDEN